MKSKTVILMIVAVTCGLGASYMTSRLLAERSNDAQKEEEKVKILVARKNIPQGTFFKNPEDWFIEKEFTLGEEPKKAVRSFEEVKDRVLSKPLSGEQWVIADDLLRKDQAGLQAVLPKGMRAMAIKVNVDTVVAGFVQPNSRVDVINTIRGGDKDPTSSTILQNMLVLAIDSIDTRDLEKKAIVSSTVTLAVTPEEVQALSLAMQLGELRLVLRPPDDTEIVNLKSTKPEDIKKAQAKGSKHSAAEEDPEGPKPSVAIRVPDVPSVDPMATTPEPPAPAEQPKPRKKHTLIVLNGDSQTKAVFLEGDDEDYEAQIQKSEAEPRREKAAAPAQAASPTPAPTPETPKPAKRPGGRQ